MEPEGSLPYSQMPATCVLVHDASSRNTPPPRRSVFVGPCHQGMARPQFADGGTASDMEGSCEYIE